MQVRHTLSRPKSAPGIIMPRLLLSQGALDMLDTFVHAATPTEINGFAYVQTTDPGTFYVASPDDVFITHQSVTIGSAHVDGGAYALALDRAVEADRASQLRLQWHSHPKDAYFSDTDFANIKNFGEAGGEWFISLVTNRDGDIHARFDRFRPERSGGEMLVQVYRDMPDTFVEYAAAQIEENVHNLAGRRGRKAVIVQPKDK